METRGRGKNLHDLLTKIAAAEEAQRETTFVAPCVRGGKVRARVAGLVATFTPASREFEGWGVFQPADGKQARLVEEADLPLVGEYLRLLKPLRVRLAHPLQRQTWLAYPANESDARQRLGTVRPVVVHLVTEGSQFEQIVARFDGGAWWFEEIDRRADPLHAEQLRAALRDVKPPEDVRFLGMTPEMRTTYDVAAQQSREFFALMERRRGEGRLRGALSLAGGELREFHDRGEFWLVEWTTADGQQHTSAIAKADLTVVSAGICLSGQDRRFDLQSLVGVMEGQWDG